MPIPRSSLTDTEYLEQIERLARGVVDAAYTEGWLAYGDDPADTSPLERSVNRLAGALRHHHFDGDGCLPEERERPVLRLAGVALLRPGLVPIGVPGTYEEVCARLGVEARADGVALWNTWGDNELAVTMVVTDVAATETLLRNWSLGIAIYPTTPLPSQVVSVRQGWFEPMNLSPRAAHLLGVPPTQA